MAEGPVAILFVTPGETPADGQEARVLRFSTKKVPARRWAAKLSFAVTAIAMQVQVETYVDEGGAEKLRRFRLDDRVIEVIDNIDQWYGSDYRYIKVRSSDGSVYVLRLNEARAEWELTMYQRAQPEDAAMRA